MYHPALGAGLRVKTLPLNSGGIDQSLNINIPRKRRNKFTADDWPACQAQI